MNGGGSGSNNVALPLGPFGAYFLLEPQPLMPTLTLAETGDTFEVPAGTSLIEFAQERGLPLQFGCTMGSCGVCCVVIEAGMGNLNPKSDVEDETTEMVTNHEAARLACQIVIEGDVTLRPAE